MLLNLHLSDCLHKHNYGSVLALLCYFPQEKASSYSKTGQGTLTMLSKFPCDGKLSRYDQALNDKSVTKKNKYQSKDIHVKIRVRKPPVVDMRVKRVHILPPLPGTIIFCLRKVWINIFALSI